MKKKTITALLFCAFVYLMFSFLLASLNPVDWSIEFRGLVVFFWAIIIIDVFDK